MAKTRDKTAAHPTAGSVASSKGKQAKPASPKKNARKTAKKPAPKTHAPKTPRSKKETAKGKAVANPTKQRGFIARLKRWIIIAILVLIAYPFVFTIIYKIPFIHPVSNLMVYEALFGYGAKREWLDLEDISPNLRRSIIMSEDGQFCSHHGVDWGALKEVAEDALEGKATRGASTISMQLAKNLFLWNSRSYIRKFLEIPIAMWLDIVLGKKRVMEIYLNVAEWDKGKFGVEEGAKSYFKISAKDMTRRQAALLAVTLPNPVDRNAAKPTRNMSRVAKIVERRARRGSFYVQCVFDE